MARLTIKIKEKIYNTVDFSGNLTLGREQENDVVLQGKQVSRYHAIIYQCSSSGYVLQDLSSKNHTKVFGRPIHQYQLHQGAIFQICDYKIFFEEETDNILQDLPLVLGKKNPFKNSQKDSLLETVFSPSPLQLETFSNESLLQLLSLSNTIVSTLDYNEVLSKSLEFIMTNIGAIRGCIALKNEQGKLFYACEKGFPPGKAQLNISKTILDLVVLQGQAILTGNAEDDPELSNLNSVDNDTLKSVLCVPLLDSSGTTGCIYVDNQNLTNSFSEKDLLFLTFIASQVSIAVHNAGIHNSMKNQLRSLQQMIPKDQIIIKSNSMKDLYALLEKAGMTNAAVLISGESGVGKELVAKAIHTASKRQGRFITINCAALPENLMESELFGYEKGAFTGADRQKPGMFELADKGTLFLDETGELPMNLQAKLLRVLQEGRVMRLGGNQYITFDVRVVSATNRDLKKMVGSNTFRGDLYYRLAQMPLTIPALRERKADILPLATFLLAKFCGENNLAVPAISKKALLLLQKYQWPGNINDLKNALIQAAITSYGNIINTEHLPIDIQAEAENIMAEFEPLEEIEKRHITKAIRLTKGNKKKAAEILGIARDTIHKKLEKYAIST